MGLFRSKKILNTLESEEKITIIKCLDKSRLIQITLLYESPNSENSVSKLKHRHQECVKIVNHPNFTKKQLLKVANFIANLKPSFEAIISLKLTSHFSEVDELMDDIIKSYEYISRVGKDVS